MANTEWKEKMIRQLEMRLDERKQDRRRFDDRLLTDALINCVLHNSEWHIPVGIDEEMDNWYDPAVTYDEETGETRIQDGEYEAVMTGNAEDRFFRRQVLRMQDGSLVLAAYTSFRKNRLGEPGYAQITAAVPCRKILRDFLADDGVTELVLNPGTDDLFTTKEQAEYLLRAAERQVTPRPAAAPWLQRGVSTRMTMTTPLQQEAFANVETVLRSLRDMQFEFLICDLLSREDDGDKGGYRAEYVQAAFGSQEGILRVEICLTWEMERITHRMLLYEEMPEEETVGFFRELLTEGRIPERTREFHVYFEDKREEEEEW